MTTADPLGEAHARRRNVRFWHAFIWLLIGTLVYGLALAIALLLYPDPRDALAPVIGPSLYLTPLFGLPYLIASARQRGYDGKWETARAGFLAKHSYCARCGAPLQLVAAGHRAQCTNPDCARLHFPRTDAAVIMLVEHDGACLLGRQASWPPGRYSTLAGFVEPGESLEDAVRREVAEEAGVIVDEVHYHSSQPWPMRASLMVGFIATAVSRRIDMRDQELEDARWFTPQQIVESIADGSFVPSTALSVSYRLLAYWLQQRAGLDLDRLAATIPSG